MELELDDQPTAEDTVLLGTEPGQAKLLSNVEKTRRALIKTGRVLGKAVTRYCELRRQTLYYFTSRNAQQAKGHYPLLGCVALSAPGHDFPVRLTTRDMREMRVLAHSQQDRNSVLLYLRLASNGDIARAFEVAKAVPPVPPMPELPLRPISPPLAMAKVVPETPVVQFQGFKHPAFLDDEEYVPAKLPTSQIAPKMLFPPPEAILTLEEESEGTRVLTPKGAGSVAEQRTQGMRMLWNYRLDAAEKHFRGLTYVDLRCALHYAEVFLFRVVLTGSRKDVQEGSAALQRTEDPLLQSDEWVEVLRAEVGIFRCILLFISGQRLKAFLTLRTAWKLYRKHESMLSTIEDDDIVSRVSFGLGLFYLLMTLIPSSIATLLRLAGFCGDRNRGLELLLLCSRTRGSRGPMALIVLSVYYIDMEPDLERAEELLESGVKQYPTCVLFFWVSSIMMWKNGKVTKAISEIQKALTCCGPDLAKKAAFLKYELGWFFFLRLKWSSASELFQSILGDCLALSSELDVFVKDMLTAGQLAPDRESAFEGLYSRRFVTKQKSRNRWLENVGSSGDRVYIPHKACLIIQLAGCFAAQEDRRAVFWLKVTKIAAGNPCASRTKVDEEFGALAEIFLRRDRFSLLPYELVYFLKQAAKLQPDMLAQIYESAEQVARRSGSRGQEVELYSARMLQIMAMSLMGETFQACGLSDAVRWSLNSLPEWGMYLKPHTLYWCSRAYIAQQRFEDAVSVLNEAKKLKNYVFCIKGKLTRLLGDIRDRL